MLTTTQPTLQDNDKSVTKIQAKISQLEANLASSKKNTFSIQSIDKLFIHRILSINQLLKQRYISLIIISVTI